MSVGLGHSALRSARRDVALAVMLGVIAFASIVGGSAFGDVHGRSLDHKLVAWIASSVLLIFGVLFTRQIAHVLGRLVESQAVPAAGAAVRLVVSAIGYVLVLFGVFEVLSISVERLIVGGALTGVIVGIAAQQALGNVFAGLVLLLARPFVVGEHIRIRSGSLGGLLEGSVVAMSLAYVTLAVEDGVLKIPNAVMLAAAVGPLPAAPPPGEPAPEGPAPAPEGPAVKLDAPG